MNFGKIFFGCFRLDIFVFGEGNVFLFIFCSLNFGFDGNNFIVKLISFLGFFSVLEIFGCIFVYYIVCYVEVMVYVFVCLIYGLYVVGCFLVLRCNGFIERLVEFIIIDCYLFGIVGDIDFDGVIRDGMGNIGGGFEIGGVEMVDG